MFCPHCGKEIADGQVFCQHCGARLAETAPISGGREKTYWEDRESKGFISGLYATLKDVLFNDRSFKSGIGGHYPIIGFHDCGDVEPVVFIQTPGRHPDLIVDKDSGLGG